MFGLGIVKHQDVPGRPSGWPLEGFARHLRTSRKQSTVDLRVAHLRLFARRHPDPWAVERRHIEDYLGQLRSGEYKRSVLSSLKLFYEWAAEEEWIIRDPARSIKTAASRPRADRPCTTEMLEAAIEAARASGDEEAWLALMVQSRTGIRRAEAASIHSRDISDDGQWLRVTGKGDRQRLVPLSGEVLALIRRRGDGWLFPGRFGGPVKPGTIAARTRRYLPIRNHALRHWAATSVYRASGKDIILVQTVLGHASVSTTQVYIEAMDDRTADDWNGAMARALQRGARADGNSGETPEEEAA
jgi:integrase